MTRIEMVNGRQSEALFHIVGYVTDRHSSYHRR